MIGLLVISSSIFIPKICYNLLITAYIFHAKVLSILADKNALVKERRLGNGRKRDHEMVFIVLKILEFSYKDREFLKENFTS